MKKVLFTLLCLLSVSVLSAQMVSQYWSFDWASTTSVNTSTTVLANTCYGGDLTVTLTTDLPHQMNNNGSGSPLSYAHPVTSVLVPYPTMVTPLNFRTTITFSTPIRNPGILLRDLDDDSYMAGPEEHLLDFEVNGVPSFPSSVTPTFGSYSLGGGTVTPLAEGCIGWLRFGGTVSSISFLYTRPITNYAFLLDSLVFDCRCQTRTLGADPSPLVTSLDGSIIIQETGCGQSKLELVDISGKVVLTRDAVDKGSEIPTQGLSEGIYLARFECDGEVLVKKFWLRP
jgi:hypothetical protein